MNSERFKTLIELYHIESLSKILGLNHGHNGIDLWNDILGIEVKCRYIKYGYRVAVHSYQIEQFRNENKNKELFWCFLFYDLSIAPTQIKSEKVNRFVTRREIWFIEWNWINQFPISNAKTGPYVYIGKTQFPDSNYFKKFHRRKDNLFVPNVSVLETMLA